MPFLAKDVRELLHDFDSFVIAISQLNDGMGSDYIHSILEVISKRALSVVLLYGNRDPLDTEMMIPSNIEKMVYYAHSKGNVRQFWSFALQCINKNYILLVLDKEYNSILLLPRTFGKRASDAEHFWPRETNTNI